MGETHTVRLEPVGIEFDVDEDETVLDGAFRQGLMLMHGCKEGQCAACKSFLLDGEVDMDRYSTFALPDFEEEEGWTLLCKAHAVSDLEVELVNYDEEILRSGKPVRTCAATVAAVEPLTADIHRLAVDVDSGVLDYYAGQYADIQIPGGEDHRSFSMAGVPSDGRRLEFMIKHYPGGRLSGMLADGTIAAGTTLQLTGPYGVFTLRDHPDRRLVFVGGGAGMAPIVALLRAREEQGCARPSVFYYGARTEADLFHVDELRRLEGALPDFRFVPALSEGDWEGEQGLITDVLDRLEGSAGHDLADADVYVCGPPPMVDAAVDLLVARGADEAHIFFDKFTTTEAEAPLP